MDKILKEVLSKQFGVPTEKITNDTRVLEDLKADSVDIVELIMNIEGAFNIIIEDVEYEDKQTVGDLLALVKSKLLT